MEQEFSRILRDWYRKNGRKLPWRETKDPYKIWISEIILQQTRVDQGLPYYLKFITAFPDIHSLANASIDKILRLWQGLGYYSRARNLHAAAKEVSSSYKGIFPNGYQEIRSLKGVGDYTAAAIASFAYDLPYPVLDGNVFRFLSRLTGTATPIDSNRGKQEFKALAGELLDPAHAAEHNQAIMELGALICKPLQPRCDECPFAMACHAYIYSMTSRLPVKEKKQKVKKRYFHYFFFSNGVETIIQRRTGTDIWKGLFEFPLIETTTEKIDIQTIELPGQLGFSEVVFSGQPLRLRHLLSHQELIVHFWKAKINGAMPKKSARHTVPLQDLHKVAFPQLMIRYLESQGLV